MAFETKHSPPLTVEFDEASRLPSLPSIIHDVRILLEKNGYIGVVLLDLEPLNEIEAECGSQIYNQLIAKVANELGDLRVRSIRSGDIVCAVRPFGEQVAVFLEGPRKGNTFSSLELEVVADRIWMALAPQVAALTRAFGTRGQFRLGYALVLPNPMIQSERLIYRGLDQARVMAEDYSRRVTARGRERLSDLIVNGQLTTVFQPIIELSSSATKVEAYEALIRGPAGSDMVSPAMLFNLASHADMVSELDRACLESTLQHASGLPDGTLLFANVMPTAVNDPAFRARMINQGMSGVEPSRVVLELNEGVAIRSYEVLSAGIDELREHGVRVAVDDLGAGYANLDHVLKLRPDFLKLDISLIRGVHESPVKKALIQSMVAVGEAVGATVIAEGVEEAEELDTLVSLGVRWGQGYLFARPEKGFVQPGPPLRRPRERTGR